MLINLLKVPYLAFSPRIIIIIDTLFLLKLSSLTLVSCKEEEEEQEKAKVFFIHEKEASDLHILGARYFQREPRNTGMFFQPEKKSSQHPTVVLVVVVVRRLIKKRETSTFARHNPHTHLGTWGA